MRVNFLDPSLDVSLNDLGLTNSLSDATSSVFMQTIFCQFAVIALVIDKIT